MVEVVCLHNPNHVFSAFPSTINRGYAKFCSRECYRDHQRTPRNIKARFWSFVGVRGEDECWPWLRSCYDSGYGQFDFTLMNGRKYKVKASRFAWIVMYGRTGGLYVLHHCDNPPCCNPYHLFLGTKADNTHDMDMKGRRVNRRPEDCLRGEDQPCAKITEEDVRYIRSQVALGRSQRSVAAEIGVITFGQVNSIVLRKSWAHVV